MSAAGEDSAGLTLAQDTLNKVQAFHASGKKDRKRRIDALRAARALALELEDNDDSMFRRVEQSIAFQTLTFVLDLGIMKHMPAETGIHAEDLAKAVGVEKALLIRTMRILVATGDFKEPATDTYAHSTARGLEEDSRQYFHECLASGLVIQIMGHLPEYYASHPKEQPRSPTHNPWSWAYGMEGHDWAGVVARDPVFLKKFTKAFTAPWASAPGLGFYPFDTQLSALSAKCTQSSADGQEKVFIVDVGGAFGSSMKEIRQAYPNLKGKMVVLDLGRILANISPDYLPKELNITTMEHNFFTPQPIKGAGVYHLRRVLHDWSDDNSRQILKHLVDATDDDSKTLIAETVLEDRVTFGDCYPYWQDALMCMLGGKERSLVDWKDLFASAGLEIAGIWSVKEGSHCMMEGQKVRPAV